MKSNENDSFLKHFVIVGVGTVVNLLLGILTTPLITRLVDPNEYGQFSIFTMYSGIGLMVFCLGLDQALVRYYYDSKEIEYKKELLFKCVSLSLIVSLAVSLILILFNILKLIKFEFDIYMLTFLCIFTIIQILYRFSMAVVRLEHNSKLYSKINILLKFFYVIIAIPMLLIFKNGHLNILVCATIFSTFLCLLISVIYQKKIWNFFELKKNNNKSIAIKKLVRYAYPFIISMGITTIFQATDKFMINYYYSFAQVGIYASAISLVNVFSIIQSTFNTLWMPMAVEHYKNNPENKKFYSNVNEIITVIMFALGILLILSKDVFALFLGAKYREASFIIPFLIFNPIMYTISETTVCGLVFKEKSKLQVLVALGACITNIIGNSILVPIYGCVGASISTGLSYFVFYLLRTCLSNQFYYVDFGLKKFLLITSIVMMYALYNSFNNVNLISIMGFIVSFLTLIILYKKTIKKIFGYTYKLILKRNWRKSNENN